MNQMKKPKTGSLRNVILFFSARADVTIMLQGVSKKTLFYEIGTPGGPKTIDRVGDQSKMLSNTLYWSDVPIYPF